MNIEDVEKEIAEIDSYNKFGRDGSSLVVIRDKCPTGYNIRTMFGLNQINNVQETSDGKYQICFNVKRAQFVRYLRKLKSVV